jgi:hypothetical protein
MRVLALIAAGGLLAQSGIHPPQAGYIRDGARALRPVYGMAGSFILGAPVANEVLSAAFSGRIGLAKTAGMISVFDAEGHLVAQSEVGGGPARITFSRDGSQATAFLLDSGESIRWTGARFRVESGIPAAFSLELADGTLVLAEGGELVFRKSNGLEIRSSLEGEVLSIEQMGEAWIHVSQAGKHLAARLVEDRIEVYRLPEAAQ